MMDHVQADFNATVAPGWPVDLLPTLQNAPPASSRAPPSKRLAQTREHEVPFFAKHRAHPHASTSPSFVGDRLHHDSQDKPQDEHTLKRAAASLGAGGVETETTALQTLFTLRAARYRRVSPQRPATAGVRQSRQAAVRQRPDQGGPAVACHAPMGVGERG